MSAAPRFGRGAALLLGLLAALGPVGVDIYLPAFPAIAADLQADVGQVQLSMAAYFLALGLGQLPYGWLSDRAGRKPPIRIGLGVFITGALLAACAGSVTQLIVARFVQGIGICAVLAMMRAIVRDLGGGADAAHRTARLLMIVSVSPLLAPLVGSALLARGDWRSIFWLLAALGLVLAALVEWALPETRRPPDRPPGGMLRPCLALLRDARFRHPLAVLAAAQAGASLYLAGASQLYGVDYGFSPTAYSLVFALNALGMIGLAQANRMLILRLGMVRVIRIGLWMSALAIVPLAGARGLGSLPLLLVLPAMAAYFAAFGLVMGPASVLALEAHAEQAGIASALLGSLQFIGGAAGAALGAWLFDGSAQPMLLLQAVFALLAGAWSLRLHAPERAPARRCMALLSKTSAQRE